MIDFQGIHARHLQIFREFADFRRKSVLPIRRAQAKIERIKLMTLQAQLRLERKNSALPGELIGRRINLLA